MGFFSQTPKVNTSGKPKKNYTTLFYSSSENSSAKHKKRNLKEKIKQEKKKIELSTVLKKLTVESCNRSITHRNSHSTFSFSLHMMGKEMKHSDPTRHFNPGLHLQTRSDPKPT